MEILAMTSTALVVLFVVLWLIALCQARKNRDMYDDLLNEKDRLDNENFLLMMERLSLIEQRNRYRDLYLKDIGDDALEQIRKTTEAVDDLVTKSLTRRYE